MTADDHQRYREELLGAYILGQLEDPEVAEFERHLGECASCREEAIELREVSDLLREASSWLPGPGISAFDPPPGLKDRVVAALLHGRPSRRRRGPACIRRNRGR